MFAPKLDLQYTLIGNPRASAKSFDKAETQYRRARRHSSSQVKETSSLKLLKNHDASGLPKKSHRRKTSDSVDLKSHRDTNKAEEAPRSRARLKTRRKASSSTSSLSSSLAKHSKHKEVKECVICTETLSLRRFPNRPPTAQCIDTHEMDACRKCLRTWIRSEFATKVWDEMNCPICSTRMQYEDMREFAPSDIFRRSDFPSIPVSPLLYSKSKLN